MKSLALLQPQSLQIDFDFQNNLGNILVASSLVVLALSEVAIKNDDLEYWSIDERLRKHRTVSDFDYHVQQMLWFLRTAGRMKASIANIGSNNYHFVRYDDELTESCIRVLHTFNPKAKYMKDFLNMNADAENPRFAYIQYTMDHTKSKVRKVKMVIPNIGGSKYRSCDLTRHFEIIKCNLGLLTRNDINKKMRLLQMDANNSALTD